MHSYVHIHLHLTLHKTSLHCTIFEIMFSCNWATFWSELNQALQYFQGAVTHRDKTIVPNFFLSNYQTLWEVVWSHVFAVQQHVRSHSLHHWKHLSWHPCLATMQMNFLLRPNVYISSLSISIRLNDYYLMGKDHLAASSTGRNRH